MIRFPRLWPDSVTAAMDVFTASGAGDEALVARLLEDGADCNLGDTWTGAGEDLLSA